MALLLGQAKAIQSRSAKYAVNPVVKWAVEHGVAPPTYAILETTGRKSGQRRRTPVGNGLDGDTFWIVAEHGSRAGYVRNVRGRSERAGQGRRPVADRAGHRDADDDPRRRQREIGLRFNAAVVEAHGHRPVDGAGRPRSISQRLGASAPADGRRARVHKVPRLSFDQDTALHQVDDGVYEGQITDTWWTPRGPLGGYVMALMMRALELVVDDEARQARSVTVYFLRPPRAGSVIVRPVVERAGRSLTTASARLEQDGVPQAIAIGAFSVPWARSPRRPPRCPRSRLQATATSRRASFPEPSARLSPSS